MKSCAMNWHFSCVLTSAPPEVPAAERQEIVVNPPKVISTFHVIHSKQVIGLGKLAEILFQFYKIGGERYFPCTVYKSCAGLE